MKRPILENLAYLFDEGVEELKERFIRDTHCNNVLISGIDEGDAKEYQEALREAGLITDIDLDLAIDGLDDIPIWSFTQSVNDSSLAEVSRLEDENAVNYESSHHFLSTQELTLIKETSSREQEEERRQRHRINMQRRRVANYEAAEKKIVVVPPLFNSGIRIGRLRFLCRIVLAMGLLLTCINVLPIYLVKAFDDTGFIIAFIMIVITGLFVLIVTNQRLCDVNVSGVGCMVFIIIILGTLIFSILVSQYYFIQNSTIDFAQMILSEYTRTGMLGSLREQLVNYVMSESNSKIFQQIDIVIEWLVYSIMCIGIVTLFLMRSVKGHNPYGAPSLEMSSVDYTLLLVGSILLIFSGTYPYGSDDRRVEQYFYQTQLFEYLGVLKPLPTVLDMQYKTYLKKNLTKAS